MSCGPVNGVAELVNHLDRDSSLFHHHHEDEHSHANTRLGSPSLRAQDAANRFYRKLVGPSQLQRPSHSFQLQHRREHEHVATLRNTSPKLNGPPLNTPTCQLIANEWAAEFQNLSLREDLHYNDSEPLHQHENVLKRPTQILNQRVNIQPLRRPLMMQDSAMMNSDSMMDMAFDQVFQEVKQQGLDVTAHEQDEQDEQNGREHVAAASDQILRETAGRLLDTVVTTNQSTSEVTQDLDEKLANSEFLKFMQRLRDGDVVIEGNKVVENIAPVTNVASTATHPAPQTQANANTTESGNSPGTSFGGQDLYAEECSSKAEHDWTYQFQGNGPVMEGLTQQQLGRSWQDATNMQTSSEVDETMGVAPETQQDAIHDNEFTAMDELYNEAYKREQDARVRFAEQGERSKSIEELENAWKTSAEASFLDDPKYTQYTFSNHNRFMDFSTSALQNIADGPHLAQSILALEAIVQREPENAEAWYQLGLKQQENENETQAIAALQTSLKHDPTHRASYLSLATSFANENLASGVYHVLTEWIRHHSDYAHFLQQSPQTDRHSTVMRMFIEAAKMRPRADMDADVQTALGVLLNVGFDYEKAVDCFQAALAIRPRDYMLWNKLGATFANGGQHERAIEAYFSALEINPSYIRARYNASVACMSMGVYEQAAEHLVEALQIQQQELLEMETSVQMRGRLDGLVSTSLWRTLGMVCRDHLGQSIPDSALLMEAIDNQDLKTVRKILGM